VIRPSLSWAVPNRPFERRIFAAIAFGTFLIGSALLAILVYRYNDIARTDLIGRYLQSVRATGRAIRDYERESSRLMLNSLYLLREQEQRQGLLSNGSLRSLAFSTGVTALSIVSSSGEFIRASGQAVGKIPNFFSSCPLHKQLFNEEADSFFTPLIPSSGGIPQKFVSIPSADGRNVLHAAQQANFLRPLLEQTFFHEEALEEIAIFSPNGTVLTSYRRDGQSSIGNVDTNPYMEVDSKVEDVGSDLLISSWVQSYHYVCCQCFFSNNVRKFVYDYLVQARVSKRSLHQATANLVGLFLVSELILSLISYIAAKLVSGHLASRLNSVQSQVLKRVSGGPPIKIEGNDEISELANSFNTLTGKLEEAQRDLASVEKEKAIAELTSQVVHDIRSPLAALNMAARDLENLAEKDKTLIRSAVSGITDILNMLDARGEKTLGLSDEGRDVSAQLSSWLLSSIVSEKRVQFKDRHDVKISLMESAESYGYFLNVDPSSFKRLFSNLLNNAVESIYKTGQVTVKQRVIEGCLEITVEDDGRGIPADVLPQIGQKNFTFGKPQGTGLGLYGARKFLAEWGGELAVESKVGEGTTVRVRLPIAQPPAWFNSVLSIERGQTVVVVDDDASVHHVWKRRLSDTDASIEIVTLQSEKEIFDYIAQNEHGSTLFLVDQELSKTGKTGLQVVESLGFEANTILVTSRFSEQKVQAECDRLKIKMIPKPLFSVVPIRVEPERQSTSETIVLIDDSASWREIWQNGARRREISLHAFATVEEFLEKAHEFRLKDTAVYVDSDLGEGVSPGERGALKIFDLGFRKIFLTTGHSPGRFQRFWWIRGVVDKTPPF
jgi:signal transduction histidine kinase